MIQYGILLEALTNKQIEIVDNVLDGSKYKPSIKHKDIFPKGIDRVKIPISQFDEENSIKKSIRNVLNSEGYDIEDYKEGLASQEYTDKLGNHRKKIFKIGKILQNKGYVDELKQFTYDPTRSRENIGHEITLSRDKYDIAGMTSGREWERQSCMRLPSESDLGGVKYHHIKDDLKNHSLVAYLTKKGDDDIEAPLGRVLIKKYTSNEKIDGKYHHIWRPDYQVYGNVPEGFLTSVKNYMVDKYPAIEGVGYSLAKGLYPQSETEIRSIRRGIVKNNNTVTHYNQNGELHDYKDENGVLQPAIKKLDSGEYAHYKNGKLHREGDLPASTLGDSITYSINGELHRDGDKPAVYKKDGSSNFYYRYGLLHRPYGKPAYEGDSKIYYEYGLSHREGDLPAYNRVEHNFTGRNVSKMYKLRGFLHRNGDKPSIIYKSYDFDNNVISSKIEYYRKGELHRDGDKPASVEYRNYSDHSDNPLLFHKKVLIKKWFKDDLPNREDAENKPNKTISVDGKVIMQIFDHKNPFKPIETQIYPNYELNRYRLSKKNSMYNNIVKNEYLDHEKNTLEREDGHEFDSKHLPNTSSVYDSNVHGFKGISNNRNDYFKFNIDGVDHLVHNNAGDTNIYKIINGVNHIHIGRDINNYSKHQINIDDVKKLINYAKNAKYEKDDSNLYDDSINQLNETLSDNIGHNKGKILEHLLKPLD